MQENRSNGGREVTVVVPTRNRAHIIGQTLESISRQENVLVSIVVVDDASTDNTTEMVAKMSGVEVVRHEQLREQGAARNTGAGVASTPWLAFCDDDDLWAPTKLRRQLDAVETAGADWCTSSAIYVDGNLWPIGGARLRDPGKIASQIYYRNMIPSASSGLLVRRSLFEVIGGFDEAARFVEDWEFCIRMSAEGVGACVDELLVAVRQWSRSFSHRSFETQYAAFRELTEGYGRRRGVKGAKPRRSSAFEVKHRLRNESRMEIVRDLPRLLARNPADVVPIMLMLSLPESWLRELRLRRLGLEDVKGAESWIAPYRLTSDPRIGPNG